MNKIKSFEEFVSENKVNESGYVEAMHPSKLKTILDSIEDVWLEWKNGAATEKSDINPARKELLKYIEQKLK